MDIPGGLILHHVGLSWRNPPGRVTDRPRGLPVWQFNLFHHPVRLRAGGAVRRIEAPAAMFHAPGQPQWYVAADDGFSDDWLGLSGPLRPLLARYGIPAGMPFPVGNAPAIESCMRDLHRELEERAAFADEAVADQLRHLLRLLARGRLADAGGGDPRRQAVERLRRQLRERCVEPWTVARMAAEAGLGAHRFAVLYRRWTGSSPLHELTWFRIRRAQELLEAGGTTVAAVARACGFPDPLYFSRVFRRWSGMPPAAYGQRARPE